MAAQFDARLPQPPCGGPRPGPWRQTVRQSVGRGGVQAHESLRSQEAAYLRYKTRPLPETVRCLHCASAKARKRGRPQQAPPRRSRGGGPGRHRRGVGGTQPAGKLSLCTGEPHHRHEVDGKTAAAATSISITLTRFTLRLLHHIMLNETAKSWDCSSVVPIDVIKIGQRGLRTQIMAMHSWIEVALCL